MGILLIIKTVLGFAWGLVTLPYHIFVDVERAIADIKAFGAWLSHAYAVAVRIALALWTVVGPIVTFTWHAVTWLVDKLLSLLSGAKAETVSVYSYVNTKELGSVVATWLHVGGGILALLDCFAAKTGLIITEPHVAAFVGGLIAAGSRLVVTLRKGAK